MNISDLLNNQSEDLRNEMSHLGHIRERIETICADNKKALNRTNEHISIIQNNESPFVRPIYDRLWRGTEMKELYINKIRIHLTNIRLLIDTLIAENEEADSLKLTFRAELNKNQTKFGLAGLARNTVNTHIANNPSSAVGLSDFEISVLNEEPQYSIKLDGGKKRSGGKTKRRRKGKFTR